MTATPPLPPLIPAPKWFSLPLELRQRWWRETDYGRLPPSAELLKAIEEAP